MRTFSTKYNGADALETFFIEKGINRSKELLIQVFCGKANQFYISGIIDDILNVAPNAHIIGTTTYGEIYHDRSQNKSCYLSISEFEKTKIETHIISIHNKPVYDSAVELGKQMFRNAPKAVIAFAAGKVQDLHELINIDDITAGFNAVFNGAVIAGGVAGNIDNPTEIMVFNETTITTDGIVAASLISNDLIVNHGNSFDWKPIKYGNRYVILKDLPAETVLVFSHFRGNTLPKDQIDAKLKPFIDRDDFVVFYTNGEYISIDEKSLCSSETLTFLILSEKEDSRIEINDTEIAPHIKTSFLL